MRVLQFPCDAPNEPMTEENEPITKERVALANAIGGAIREWAVDHPEATRQDVDWALSIIPDMLDYRADEQ